MKTLSISLFLFSMILTVSGQDLLIRYDVVKRDVSYFKIKKTKDSQKLIPMRNPRIGANRQVKVEYVNINPFVWKQPGVNLVTVASDSVASFNPFTMLLPTSFSDRLGPLSLGLTRDASASDPQFLMCANATNALADAYNDMDKLKYNYKLTKQEILAESNKKIKTVAKTCTSSVKLDTTKSTFQKQDFEMLRSYFSDACQKYINTRSSSTILSNEVNEKLNKFFGRSGSSESAKQISVVDAVSDIEENYNMLADADFSFENSFLVSDKDVVVHMTFSLTDEFRKKTGKDSTKVETESKRPQKVKDESIFIPVRGGVQISNSAGIGFTYLGNQRQSYYIEFNPKDSTSYLQSKNDHRVIPVVGSFLNVYSRRMGVVNLGGSFGLSIALQEVFSINYMFGATAVIGRKGRVLVSGGVVLSPVTEPAKGYYVGMQTSNVDFPTELNYKPGMFFFVHYNIGKF